MTLQDLLRGVQQLNDSISVIEFEEGLAIGCERLDHETADDIRFAIVDNQRDIHISMPRCYQDGESGMISEEAQETLKQYAATLPNPLKDIRQGLRDSYDSILDPLEVEPVRKRGYGTLAFGIALTATYPISAPLSFVASAATGNPYAFSAFTYPFLCLGEGIKGVVQPQPTGMRIANVDLLTESPKDNSYVGIGTFGRLTPDHFGDHTSSKDKQGFLQVHMADGLELHGNMATYPCDGNHYQRMRHFLKTDLDLIGHVYSLKAREERVHERRRELHETNPFEVKALLGYGQRG